MCAEDVKIRFTFAGMANSVRQSFSLLALIRLTRFWNLVIIAMAQYMAACFLIDSNLLWDWRLLVLAASTTIIAAAGYIINDYYDIKIDLINKPDRVVIGKGITRRYALFFHTTLSGIGIALGLLLGLRIAAIHFVSVFLLWWYSNNLKRQPFIGNLTVALLTGVSVLLVNVLYYQHHALVGIYALFAFFMTLVREIVKDMEDLKGDNTFGCRTLPIVWGLRKTKWVIYIVLIVFGALVLYLNYVYTRLPEYYFLIFLFVPLGLFVSRLIIADTKKDFYWLSQWSKIIMLLGILSMVFI
ncbi:MAG TPA: geranylgeranylglycerol-phosphate geranylgeranyltransferase [Cyclobacteriaceae bacterium]|nr:geranylgeranylglycerol-phosphate geranylgeranyltransferase [Cyclobacteriaceae bacterium]